MKQKSVINFVFFFVLFFFLCLSQKSVQSINVHNVEQTIKGYSGASSDEDDEEYENDGRNHNEYSSGVDDDENDQIHPRKIDHQLEWDDAAIEYGPKKV